MNEVRQKTTTSWVPETQRNSRGNHPQERSLFQIQSTLIPLFKTTDPSAPKAVGSKNVALLFFAEPRGSSSGIHRRVLLPRFSSFPRIPVSDPTERAIPLTLLSNGSLDFTRQRGRAPRLPLQGLDLLFSQAEEMQGRKEPPPITYQPPAYAEFTERMRTRWTETRPSVSWRGIPLDSRARCSFCAHFCARCGFDCQHLPDC